MKKDYTYEQVELQIKKIFIEHLQEEISTDSLSVDENFLDKYGFNSIDALELLLKVEQAFDVQIPDDDLSADLIQTVESLSHYIFQLIS